MSLHSDVEALARALGVWRETGQQVFEHIASPSMMARDDGLAWLPPGGAANSLALTQCAPAWRTVDPSTAALILLGYARGLRVDIGECLACRERGGSIERRWLPATPPPSTHAMALMENEGFRCAWSGAPPGVWPYERPCPACTVDGEPTGRHTLAWERAILDAMPRDLGYDAHKYASREAAELDAIALGRLTKRDPTDWAAKETGGCWRLHEVKPGDPATRTALTVLADQAQARGDRLGDALAWWLAGPDALAQHHAELWSLVLTATLTFEMSNFSPDHDTLGQAAPGV